MAAVVTGLNGIGNVGDWGGVVFGDSQDGLME